MMTLKTELTLPAAGLSGFEPPLAEEEAAIQAGVHRFAREVLRPLGAELDRMTAAAVIAPGSPYYGVFAEFAKLGLDPFALAELPPDMAVRIESLIGEELGWGDSGLAVSLVVAGFPVQMASIVGSQELVDLCTGKIGCWMITQPDKGSDVQVFDMAREWAPGQQGNKGNVWGRIQGDEIVINGQCSAWVSNGAVAQVALGYISAEYDGSFFEKDGRPHGMSVIIPLIFLVCRRASPSTSWASAHCRRVKSISITSACPSALQWRCGTSTTGTWPRPGRSPVPTCRRFSPVSRGPGSSTHSSIVTSANRAARDS